MNNPIKSREEIDTILEKNNIIIEQEDNGNGTYSYKQPTRGWLVYECLPKMQGTILFVGVNDYTKGYDKIVPNPNGFETVDICPKRGKLGGSETKHHVCDFKELDPAKHSYDHVILFGLHGFNGYNINNESLFQDLQHAHDLLNYYGTLLWGPTPNMNVTWKEHKQIPYKKFSEMVFHEMETYFNYRKIGTMMNTDNIIWMGEKQPPPEVDTPLFVAHNNENHIFQPSRLKNPFKSMLEDELLKKKNKGK